MRESKRYERPYVKMAWSDRFQRPDLRSLRESLPYKVRRLFDAARKQLLDHDGVRESLVWYGECWRWSIEYRTRLSPQPLAVIIPSPADLQMALPLDPEFMQSLPLKRMKRAVRDGLELAQAPFDTRWGVWSLASTILDDLQDLVELKLNHLAKRVG